MLKTAKARVATKPILINVIDKFLYFTGFTNLFVTDNKTIDEELQNRLIEMKIKYIQPK